MRNVEIKVYSIDELSREAQENAYNNWINNCIYPWSYENANTLKCFCDKFYVDCYNWEYDCSCSSYNYRFINGLFNADCFYCDTEEIAENLKGVRLYKYLQNNFSDILNNRDCVFTGYYMDYVILEPIYEFYDDFNSENYCKYKDYDFNSLINDCLSRFFYGCVDDYSYCSSFEYFIEESQLNEWEYTLNGEIF